MRSTPTTMHARRSSTPASPRDAQSLAASRWASSPSYSKSSRPALSSIVSAKSRSGHAFSSRSIAGVSRQAPSDRQTSPSMPNKSRSTYRAARLRHHRARPGVLNVADDLLFRELLTLRSVRPIKELVFRSRCMKKRGHVTPCPAAPSCAE